ncbi:hypothetical protein E2C01_096084 [Portunus trituberculatus]|uniref:Uncharacterized protein n=1 Tax=Portunus trituberculatus TaxID=210409 RepID=A0A5B7JRR3_PORTR|nr:hypothetical protein [Portunus trituberculatus]
MGALPSDDQQNRPVQQSGSHELEDRPGPGVAFSGEGRGTTPARRFNGPFLPRVCLRLSLARRKKVQLKPQTYSLLETIIMFLL